MLTISTRVPNKNDEEDHDEEEGADEGKGRGPRQGRNGNTERVPFGCDAAATATGKGGVTLIPGSPLYGLMKITTLPNQVY